MATSQTCCHLPGKMLNSAAECADRAQIRRKKMLLFFAKSTFFHAGQREKKYFFHAEITFFHAGITFFHAAASSVKKSD
jgi:hypothetical protein